VSELASSPVDTASRERPTSGPKTRAAPGKRHVRGYGTRRRYRTAVTGLARTTGGDVNMAWTRPTLREICIGMEINGYLPGEL
jgi:coenzyme PQQ precursor peptide PqqA